MLKWIFNEISQNGVVSSVNLVEELSSNRDMLNMMGFATIEEFARRVTQPELDWEAFKALFATKTTPQKKVRHQVRHIPQTKCQPVVMSQAYSQATPEPKTRKRTIRSEQ